MRKKKKKKKRQHLPQPRIQQFHSHLMERKTGMFTHKNSGINLKLKKKKEEKIHNIELCLASSFINGFSLMVIL